MYDPENSMAILLSQVGVQGCLNDIGIVTNGFSHPYHLDESTFIFRDIRSNFSFFDEIHKSKQNSTRKNATFCGVTSRATLFAYVP